MHYIAQEHPATNPQDYPFAHSAAEGQTWEPLFTDSCPTVTGRGNCALCEALDPHHGHLNKVAHWTAKFAREMFPPGSNEAEAAGEWGRIAGLWHDLGKYSEAFQKRLTGAPAKVDHSSAGALAASQIADAEARIILPAIIAGHHCGLANAKEARAADGRKLTPFRQRIRDAAIPDSATPESLAATIAQASKGFPALNLKRGFRKATLTRMLFSCLTDADSVATESFCQPDSLRLERKRPHIGHLRSLQDTHMAKIAAESSPSVLNENRREILDFAISKAPLPPGWFSLNVPTGGGKTLAALSFGLHHAEGHQLRRIIFGIPFTSIIDQTASIYRDILGENNVLEHHSAMATAEDTDDETPAAVQARMTAEDWDAPVIVTTNVQLLESLFAHKRSRTRKDHRIARSVIVLDEMQSVPVGLLAPVVALLDELVKSYGCTVVVCTATQPAIEKSHAFQKGIHLDPDRHLAPPDLHQRQTFQRVTAQWPKRDDKPWSPADLASRLAEQDCSIAITHRKADASDTYRALIDEVGVEGSYHLSTFMIPVHRRKVLAEVRENLERHRLDGRPCRVVSTQLLEAGVDLDAPVLFRAMAGIDSVVQAAGRCNREGRMPEGQKGKLIVFQPESEPPPGVLRVGLETTKMLLEYQNDLDIFSPQVIQRYFEQLYTLIGNDSADIIAESTRLNFETIGQDMRLIDELPTTTILVTYDDDAHSRIADLRAQPTTKHFRRLQPYTLTVFDWVAKALLPKLESLLDDSDVLVLNTELHPELYDPHTGLRTDRGDTPMDPTVLIP